MIREAEELALVLYPEDKRPASTMTGAKALTESPKQETSVPHVRGYPLGWLTGHWEFDKVLLRAYKIIPEKDMKALRCQLRQVRLTPYTHKRTDGGWAHGVSVRKTGTVLISLDVMKCRPRTMLGLILHELAHQVNDVLLSPIMLGPRREPIDSNLISEWAADLRVADWGHDFELRRALRGDTGTYVPSEKEARRIAHCIRSVCGSWYGLVRSWEQQREIYASHPEWGVTLEDGENKEWRSPKILLKRINTVIVVDRLFGLWGYRPMNPKFVPKMMKVYEDWEDGQEL